MKEIPAIIIDINKKCIRCKKDGATEGGLCLKCILKKLKDGDFDHILKREQGVNV